VTEYLSLNHGYAETISEMNVSGRLTTLEEARELNQRLVLIDASEGWSASLRDSEYEAIDLIDVNAEDFVGRDITVRIQKPTNDRCYFFSATGFSDALNVQGVEIYPLIFVVSDGAGFRSETSEIVLWDGLPRSAENYLVEVSDDDARDDDAEEVDPRRILSRDLTGKLLSSDQRFWILRGSEGKGAHWDAWCRASTIKNSLLFASELWFEGDALKVTLQTPRKRTFEGDIDSINIDTSFIPVMQAAKWLCSPARDAEAKHEMFTQRLGRLIPENESRWSRIISNNIGEAAEGARIDYRAFVKTKSSESLKAISDLRNTVREEVTKITDKTQRMLTLFLTSMGVLLLTIGIRFSFVAPRIENQFLVYSFCILVLFIVSGGLWLQRNVAVSSLKSELKHVRRWHRQVNQVLSQQEYRSLATSPIWDAVRLFRTTLRWSFAGFVVVVVAFLAIIFSPNIEQLVGSLVNEKPAATKETNPFAEQNPFVTFPAPLSNEKIDVRPDGQREFYQENDIKNKSSN
tara:strand:+ start:2589 stop:4142 length:1554 start_codon:yes stop_codon:yes gene_type:complete